MNKTVFATKRGQYVPPADVMNHAGGGAYALDSKATLAQLALTGCFGGTYYFDAKTEVEQLKKACDALGGDLAFIAKTAVYARKNGFMKDTPAFLCAYLATKKELALEKAFPFAINDLKMLRNFMQVIRSGVLGRKSFGSRTKRLIKQWLSMRSTEKLFRQSIGQSPSLADIIKMVHPKAKNQDVNEFYKYILGKEGVRMNALPQNIQDFERFKKEGGLLPDVPFQMLTALPLTTEQWLALATNMTWNQLRQNLNSLQKHGVYERDAGVIPLLAERLKTPDDKVFPYSIFTTFLYTETAPRLIREAIQDALDASVKNVPIFPGKVVVAVDVSGSMTAPVTGSRGSATSKMQCRQVAGLFAATLYKHNDAKVFAFDDSLYAFQALNSRDSLATMATNITSIGGGGTNLSLPLAGLVQAREKADLIVYLSDNESWIDWEHTSKLNRDATGAAELWRQYKVMFPDAKMVCVNLAPNPNTQVREAKDVLNVGGYSDTIFDVISLFLKNELGAEHWVSEIEKMVL